MNKQVLRILEKVINHSMLLTGDCMPAKSSHKKFLVDYIEISQGSRACLSKRNLKN